MNSNVKKIVYIALFAALTCAATFAIKIPTPGTGGYIHPGDAIVILSGVMLGPVYGAVAAALGSAMADLLGGYIVYAPITLLVKGVIAFLCGIVYKRLGTAERTRYIAVGVGGVIDMVLVAGGYYGYEIFFYGVMGALASVPANLIQGVSGLVLALVLYPVLHAIPEFRNLKMI